MIPQAHTQTTPNPISLGGYSIFLHAHWWARKRPHRWIKFALKTSDFFGTFQEPVTERSDVALEGRALLGLAQAVDFLCCQYMISTWNASVVPSVQVAVNDAESTFQGPRVHYQLWSLYFLYCVPDVFGRILLNN